MADAGYVRIYRTLLGHPAFRNDGEALAFAWMVMRASWRPKRVRYRALSVTLQRGQLAISVRDLATALDRPKGWVERLLTRLKSETMVRTATETGVTVITICKYDDYQAERDTDKTPRGTPQGTRAGQAQDTEQRREEGKKEEVGTSAPTARATKSKPPRPKPEAGLPWHAIPKTIPLDAWHRFLSMRREKRKPVTVEGAKLLLGELAKLADDGHPPGKVLDQSTLNGWTGVFKIDPPSDRGSNGNGRQHQTPRESTRETGQRLADELSRSPEAR